MNILDLKDRFARGFLAGLIATVSMAGLNLFSYYILGFTERRYYNFAATFIFGRRADALGEHILSQLVQIGHGVAMGIIFAYFIIGIRSKNYLLKGMLWGLTIEFLSFAIVIITRMDNILPVTLNTAISMLITSAIWGAVLARTLYILDERYETETDEKKNTKLNMKYVLSPVPAKKMQPKKKLMLQPTKLIKHTKK